MKVAAVCALPFHIWILEDLIAEFRNLGCEVQVFTHTRKHQADWLQHDQDGPVLTGLRAFNPDVVICAEYPFAFLREAAGAPVVTVRHSLASRGNTWEPEQSDADYVVTWSDFDKSLFDMRGVTINEIRAGCVFAARLANSTLREKFAARKRMGFSNDQRVIGWAPTWNAEFNYVDNVIAQLELLRRRGMEIVVRAHPGRWEQMQGAEQFQQDKNVAPWDLLMASDVLVTDVSGIGLLPAAMQWFLPVVHVDPMKDVSGLPQYQQDGPEWVFRSQMGPRSLGGQWLSGTILEALETRTQKIDYDARREVRGILLGTNQWTAGSCKRAAVLIIETISSGTNGQKTTTN